MTPSFPTRRSSSYTYDAVGNRLTETDGTGVTTAYSYDEENRLLAMGAVSFAYDDAGNQVARTEGGVTQGYGYDPRGFMRSEERRVGKECVRPGRSRRWAGEAENNKKIKQ